MKLKNVKYIKIYKLLPILFLLTTPSLVHEPTIKNVAPLKVLPFQQTSRERPCMVTDETLPSPPRE